MNSRARWLMNGPVIVGIELYQVCHPNLPRPEPSPFREKARNWSAVTRSFSSPTRSEKKQFKFANDWGLSWGDRGYGYLSDQYIKAYSSDA
jgi:hypothetical protein